MPEQITIHAGRTTDQYVAPSPGVITLTYEQVLEHALEILRSRVDNPSEWVLADSMVGYYRPGNLRRPYLKGTFVFQKKARVLSIAGTEAVE